MKFIGVLAFIVPVLIGCGRQSAPASPATPPGETWQIKADQLTAAIKPDMTQPEVLAAAGEPTERKTILSGEIVEVWYYELARNVYFKVRFNRAGRVINAQVDSVNRIG